MRAFVLIPIMLGAGLATAQDQQEREAFLADVQYDTEAPEPAYRELSPAEVRAGSLVVSSRNYAWFGFNTPEVSLHLPDVDNSAFAEVEFAEPELTDNDGFLIETGGVDAESRTADIRFRTPDDDGPASYARAMGTIGVRYPVAVETRSFAAGDRDTHVSIDGPFVEYTQGAVSSGLGFPSVRAYDAEGRRLRQAPWSYGRSVDGRASQMYAFHGAVARVELDRVSRWVDMHVTYDLPIAPPRDESTAGFTPTDEKLEPTPGGEFTIEVGEPYDADPSPWDQASGGLTISRAGLSADAQKIAAAIEQLAAAIPEPPAIVQVLVSRPDVVSLLVDTGSAVDQYVSSGGELSGPQTADTRWMDCTDGLPEGALDLGLLPSLWDRAPVDADAEGAGLLQMIVAQVPCGTPWIRVVLEGPRGVRYAGDGSLLAVE